MPRIFTHFGQKIKTITIKIRMIRSIDIRQNYTNKITVVSLVWEVI